MFRNLLYDVYQVRWTSYPVLGKKKENLEDFITSYMSKKVVEIWPKGWMRYEELQKEIERRKNAIKKAKEKEKSKTLLPAVPNAAAVQHAITSNTVTFSTQPNPPPETNPRSNANSDTDSVASSSNTSSSLKRKNTDPNPSNKQTKAAKAAKLNGEQHKSSNTKNMPTGLDLTSPNKKSDHSINHIISPTSMAAAQQATTSSIFSATVAALSQPLKHSSNTHVIDLDNYTCPSEIMQQAAAANAALASYTMTSSSSNTNTVSRRESSGADSEIEIVGYFPPKSNVNKKQKTNSRSATPNSSNQTGSEKTYNNNNNNKKKQPPSSTITSGALNLLGVEGYNKMVNAFMDLGEVSNGFMVCCLFLCSHPFTAPTSAANFIFTRDGSQSTTVSTINVLFTNAPQCATSMTQNSVEELHTIVVAQSTEFNRYHPTYSDQFQCDNIYVILQSRTNCSSGLSIILIVW